MDEGVNPSHQHEARALVTGASGSQALMSLQACFRATDFGRCSRELGSCHSRHRPVDTGRPPLPTPHIGINVRRVNSS